jgi:hypothetical protein
VLRPVGPGDVRIILSAVEAQKEDEVHQ